MAVYDFSGSFRNLNNAISDLGKGFEEADQRKQRAGIGDDLLAGNYSGAAAKAIKAGDLNTGLKILETGNQRSDTASFNQGLEALLGGGLYGQPQQPSQTPIWRQSGKLSDYNLYGGQTPDAVDNLSIANLGSASQVETRFMGAARDAGLTSPMGLAALAATGQRESGWSPQNANRTWSDPSQSGEPGTAGGILSWRGPRLQNLYRFAQSRGEQPGAISPETQAQFVFQEDPTLVHRLNAAQTPEEANRVMAQAWRYAGFDGNGPEYQARLNATRQYVTRYNGQGEGQGGEPNQPAWSRSGQSVQVAQQGDPRADMPAPNAIEAQQAFVIPGSNEVVPAGTRLTPRAVNMMKMLGANVPEHRKEPVRQLLKLELEASNPAAQLDLENKRLDVSEKRRKAARGDVTNDITEYEYARRQGYMGSFTDFATSKAQRTTITNDLRGEGAETKAIGEAAGKRAGEAMNAAFLATKQLQRIGQVDALLKNLETGKMAPARMTLGAWGKALGVNDDALKEMGIDPAKVGDAQALSSITGRMVIDMIGAGGFPANNFSDADRQFIVGTVPQLANDPRGNRIMIEAARRTAQLDIEKAKEWRQWRHKNKGGSYDDFELTWADKMSEKDHFSDLAEQANALTRGQARPRQGGQPARIQSPQQYQALPRGATYLDPQGNVRTKQ